MEGNVQTGGGKRVHIELLRILACYLVIFNHAGGISLFARCEPGSLAYWVYCIMGQICNAAVPLFFAISGALLLPRTESIRDVYRKRVLRVAIVLLLVSALYHVWRVRLGEAEPGLRYYFYTLYTSGHYVHLWYLYAFLPFLMALPLLRPMAQSLKNEHFLYMVLLWLLFAAVLPVAEYLILQGESHNTNFNMNWLISPAVCYPFLGYYIENRMDPVRAKKALPLLWAVNTVCLLACGLLFRRILTVPDSDYSFFMDTFVLINMTVIYITVKSYFHDRTVKPAAAGVICSLGGCTFGIYLLHFIVLVAVRQLGIAAFAEGLVGNEMLTVLLVSAVTMAISCAIVLVLKKIPYLNRLL